MKQTAPMAKKPKSPWLGVLLNWIGLGYIYSGNWIRFVLWWVVTQAVLFGSKLIGYPSQMVGVVVLISLIDVYNLIKKYNEQLTTT